MMEISIIVASFLSNMIVGFVKPPKEGLSLIELDKRKNYLRALNALIGLLILITTYALTGGELDTNEIMTYVEILVGFIVTFLTSQGAYLLPKKW